MSHTTSERSRPAYVAVEGCIGAGKTTLARLLALDLGFIPICENFSANPFLEGFYRFPKAFALPTEISFVLIHSRQLRQVRRPQSTVSDFLFDKDELFARLTLSTAELAFFLEVYRRARRNAPQPDLVIYLRVNDDLLMQRIGLRRRTIESSISRNYLAELNRRYQQFFAEYRDAPLLTVDIAQRDFLQNESDRKWLVREVNATTCQ